ncbi:ankyrin, putative [Plasmodium sp. DRC-Itaito]|nr:ankyrin, putative [Plasmodium sp. DRC-Itaito]
MNESYNNFKTITIKKIHDHNKNKYNYTFNRFLIPLNKLKFTYYKIYQKKTIKNIKETKQIKKCKKIHKYDETNNKRQIKTKSIIKKIHIKKQKMGQRKENTIRVINVQSNNKPILNICRNVPVITHGILKNKNEGKMKKENEHMKKKVRINMYNIENATDKCFLKKKVDNERLIVENEGKTLEGYLTNLCRSNNFKMHKTGDENDVDNDEMFYIHNNNNNNNNNTYYNNYIINMHEESYYNYDSSYSALDVYMEEYRDTVENSSNIDDISDLQPIHLASKEGNIELIKNFLKEGIYINSKTKIRKFTPLHLSASKGDIESVKFLIENNADINALSSDNETPLWCASLSNHFDICKYFIEKGALLNLNVDKRYDSPLHAASMMGNYEIVKLLIEHGADITCLDLNMLEPVHYASFEGHKGIVKYLIFKQIEQSLKKKMNDIVYIMKKYNVYSPNLERHYYLKYKSILKKRITSKILCCAITSGNYKIVNIILKKGADPNYFDVRLQLFPIHAASITGNIKIFKSLVNKGANIFMRTICNNLPIDLTEDKEIKQFILKCSRKINLRNAWIIRLKKKNSIIARLPYDTFYYLCTFF